MTTREMIMAQPSTPTLATAVPLLDPAEFLNVVLTSGRTGTTHARGVMVPIASLITDHDVLVGVTRDVIDSNTPHEPMDLCVRESIPGRYEISDGHHRLVQALLSGATHILADIWPIADDEPYEGPFYDFAGLLNAALAA